MRILVTGARGMLGQAVVRCTRERGHEVVALGRYGLDVRDAAAVRARLATEAPDAVVYCAGYTAVDDAERNEAAAHAVNARAAGGVGAACRSIGARLVYPSSDYVFDGVASKPYTPDETPRPINAYGRSKLAGEEAVRSAGDHLVVRTSWLYAADGRNFVRKILVKAGAGDVLRVVHDQRGSPSWCGDVATAMIRLLEVSAPAGVYHAANGGAATWYELAVAACEVAGIPARVEPCTTSEFPRPAPRPAYSVLDCTATEALVGPIRPWREALTVALAQGLWSGSESPAPSPYR